MRLRLAILCFIATCLTSTLAFGQARVAVGHYAPFADTLDGTSVTIQANGANLYTDVKFKDFVDYATLTAGTYTIDVIPTGTTTVAITGTFDLVDGQDYTVFAAGDGVNQPLQLIALADDNTAPAAGSLKLRVVHAAPFADTLAATEVSIRTGGGDLVGGLTGVPFGASSDFLEIPAGNYDLKVASNDGQVNYIDIVPLDLPEASILTVFAVGNITTQPLGIIAFPLGEIETRAPVDNSANGWWDLGGGQGIIAQPIPSQNRLVGTLYTYPSDGSGDPVFYTFDSCNTTPGDSECATPGGFDGVSTVATIYQTTGGTLGDADASVTTTAAGTLELDVLSCGQADATISINGETPVSGTANRLTIPIPCTE